MPEIFKISWSLEVLGYLIFSGVFLGKNMLLIFYIPQFGKFPEYGDRLIIIVFPQWPGSPSDPCSVVINWFSLGKGVYSQLGNMHWKVDEHLKYLTNFLKRKYSLEI